MTDYNNFLVRIKNIITDPKKECSFKNYSTFNLYQTSSIQEWIKIILF